MEELRRKAKALYHEARESRLRVRFVVAQLSARHVLETLAMTTEQRDPNEFVDGDAGAVDLIAGELLSGHLGPTLDVPSHLDASSAAEPSRKVRNFVEMSNTFDVLKSVVDRRSSSHPSSARRSPHGDASDRDVAAWEDEGGTTGKGASRPSTRVPWRARGLAVLARMGAILKWAWTKAREGRSP